MMLQSTIVTWLLHVLVVRTARTMALAAAAAAAAARPGTEIPFSVVLLLSWQLVRLDNASDLDDICKSTFPFAPLIRPLLQLLPLSLLWQCLAVPSGLTNIYGWPRYRLSDDGRLQMIGLGLCGNGYFSSVNLGFCQYPSELPTPASIIRGVFFDKNKAHLQKYQSDFALTALGSLNSS